MATASFILGFWQFGSPGMLAWGAAAAVPILIHLWRRHSYRQESWAAMEFLLAAMRKNARRRQVEQWLLLAMRVGILLLFALALADPQWVPSPGLAGETNGKNAHVVIVIDGSYSMGFKDGENTRFEQAKEMARQYVAAGPEGDVYSLVLMAEVPRAVIAEPVFERSRVAHEIDALQLTHGGANLAATLAEIEAIVRQTPAATDHRVLLFTDLQKVTWGQIESDECRSQLAGLRSISTLELVDLGRDGESNLAVGSLTLDSTASGMVVAGHDVQFQVQIQNFGLQDRTQQALQIFVNGHQIADGRIDCPAGAATPFACRHRFDAPGEYVVEARLADDGLELDNRRWLSVQARDAIRVLCIGGRPADTRHLALALRPQRESGQSIDITEATDSRLLDANLREFDCVVLSNVGQFSQPEAALLYRFVNGGGGLIVFLGDQVQAQNYNQLLGDHLDARVLPAMLGEVTATGNYRLNPLEYRHPIVAPFRGFPQAGLLTTPIWKYVRLEPAEGASVAMAFESGDPAILEMPIGRGRCILIATAASPSSIDRSADPPAPWTALPTWPSFPPLVHEMLRFAVSGRGQDRNTLVGETLVREAPIHTADTSVVISAPDGVVERTAVDFVGSAGRWRYGPVQFSGIYAVQSGSESQSFAVNVNSKEGDLARLDVQLLPPEFHRDDISSALLSAAKPRQTAFSLYRWLLAVIAALLIGEPWLAWLFGRGRG